MFQFSPFTMELGELINPHYAFPVVGVLLCALLVFAFGFKSPAQPPSFDFDEEKKTSGSKKKKPVKKTSSSTQGTSLPEDNLTEKSAKQSKEKQVVAPKARQHKNSLTTTVQASTNKQPIKNKKSEKNEKNALKKTEEKVKEEKEKQTIKKEETGEWVQQLTRKEKKNRKRDEVNGNGEEDDIKIDGSIGGTPEKKKPAPIRVQDSNESSPSKKKKKKSAGNKENGDAIPLEENVKLENAKNEILLKEKLDKVDDFKNDAEIKIMEELKETNNITLQPVEAKEYVGIQPSVKAALPQQVKAKESPVEASPKTKKSKKNKAKLENSVIDDDQAIHVTPESTVEVSKQEISPRDTKSTVAEVQAEDASKTQVVAAGGVAFDELQDVWQEPKVQKKKKKARKDQ